MQVETDLAKLVYEKGSETMVTKLKGMTVAELIEILKTNKQMAHQWAKGMNTQIDSARVKEDAALVHFKIYVTKPKE